MKAKVTIGIAGVGRTYRPGEIVEGATAIDLVQAGHAVVVRDGQPEGEIVNATVTRRPRTKK